MQEFTIILYSLVALLNCNFIWSFTLVVIMAQALMDLHALEND